MTAEEKAALKAAAKTAARAAEPRVVDATKAIAEAVIAGAANVVRYRVLRPILHGGIALAAGELVDMVEREALHLLETGALAPHIVPQEVTRVVDLSTPIPAAGAVKASITGTEVAAAENAPGALAPDATQPVLELDNRGDVRAV